MKFAKIRWDFSIFSASNLFCDPVVLGTWFFYRIETVNGQAEIMKMLYPGFEGAEIWGIISAKQKINFLSQMLNLLFKSTGTLYTPKQTC